MSLHKTRNLPDIPLILIAICKWAPQSCLHCRFARIALFIIMGTVFTAPPTAYGQSATTDNTQPISSISTTDAVADPVPATNIDSIIHSQRIIMATLFCVEPTYKLWFITLDRSPIEFPDASYDGGALRNATWKTLAYKEYDWTEGLIAGEIDTATFNLLSQNGMNAELIIGELNGPCASATMVALSLSWVDAMGVRQYGLIPVQEVGVSVYELLDDLNAGPDGDVFPLTAIAADCDVCDLFCCLDRYKGRLQDALNDNMGEIVDMVPPMGLGNTACFLLCTPFVSATPAAYLACAGACNLGVAIGGFINLDTANDTLDFKHETALQSYCLCIDFKETHCDDPEPDVVGCPGGPVINE